MNEVMLAYGETWPEPIRLSSGLFWRHGVGPDAWRGTVLHPETMARIGIYHITGRWRIAHGIQVHSLSVYIRDGSKVWYHGRLYGGSVGGAYVRLTPYKEG